MTGSFSLPDRLLEYGRTQPDSVAVVMGRNRVSYAELAEMVLAALIAACMMARRSFLLPSTALGDRSLGALLGRADCQGLLAAGEAGIRVHPVDVRPDADPGAPQSAQSGGQPIPATPVGGQPATVTEAQNSIRAVLDRK